MWELGKVLTEPSHLDRGTHTHTSTTGIGAHIQENTHTQTHLKRNTGTHKIELLT